MRYRHSHRQETFSPLQDKTIHQVLRQLFVTEFGYGNKLLFAEAMIDRILDTIQAFTRPASLLQPGQMLWMAVAHDGRKHAYQRMKDTPQVPVILDLVTADELQTLSNGHDFPSVRRRRHARLLDQALAQKGVLAQGDLAAITLTSQRQVSKDIAKVQQTEDRLLPYRGSVQDLGATFSHRAEVARLLEAGFIEPQICRMLSPAHNLRAVENYAQTYKNVLKLLERGFAPSEISGILSIGPRLVNDYLDLVRLHHPEILERNAHIPHQPGSTTDNPKGHMS
jgi:hypothetical protein